MSVGGNIAAAFLLLSGGVLIGATVPKLLADPAPARSRVSLPPADRLESVWDSLDAPIPPEPTKVAIRFVLPRGWKVRYGEWGGGRFGRPGFDALLTPPRYGAGYGQVDCEVLNADGVQIGAHMENWIDTHGPIMVTMYFELLGEPARVVCRPRIGL